MRLILLLAASLSSICFAETFYVALPMLPEINPITNQVNVGNYIGAHLYYPLFERNQDGKFNSVFLDIDKSRSLDAKFDRYELCLKKNVKFSDNTAVEVADLISSIQAFADMYPQSLPLRKIKNVTADCINLYLEKSFPGLFGKLTGMASTVLRSKDIKAPFPIGLGSYYIEAKSDDELVLKSIKDSSVRFDKIHFKLIKKSTDDISKFSDINQLPPNKERDDKFPGVATDAPSFKIYSFVLNVKKPQLRDEIRAYLEEQNWDKIFGLTLSKSNYFLPWLKSNYPITNQKKHKKIKNKIPFLIPNFYDIKKIESIVKNSFLSELIFVKSLPANEFPIWAFSGKEYIGLMGFDSSGSMSSLEGDFSIYFESFFSKENRIISKPLLRIKNLVEKSMDPKLSSFERLELMKNAEKYLSDQDYISPLGKVKRTFLYPSDIKISEWYDFLSGIPRIDRIK